MNRLETLISKLGDSFLLNGTVYLSIKAFPSKIQKRLSECTNTKIVYEYGLVLEIPGKNMGLSGVSREHFNACMGIANDSFIPNIFSADEYSNICEVIELFDCEERRWDNIKKGPVNLLYSIREYQNLLKISSAEVLLIKKAVQAKKAYVNTISSGLNQISLTRVIYNFIYSRFYIENISQLKQKNFAKLLDFLEDLDVYSFMYSVKGI